MGFYYVFTEILISIYWSSEYWVHLSTCFFFSNCLLKLIIYFELPEANAEKIEISFKRWEEQKQVGAALILIQTGSVKTLAVVSWDILSHLILNEKNVTET